MKILIASNKIEQVLPIVRKAAKKNQVFNGVPKLDRLMDDLDQHPDVSDYDKVVILLSSLKDWDIVQRKALLQRFLAWAKILPEGKEVIFIDSDGDYDADCMSELSGYATARYIKGRFTANALPDIVLNNQSPEPSTSEPIKPKKSFSLFGKKRAAVQEPVTAPAPAPYAEPESADVPNLDAPLFADVPQVEDVGDADLHLEMDFDFPEEEFVPAAPAPKIETEMTAESFDMPLFPEEPAQPVQPVPTPQPVEPAQTPELIAPVAPVAPVVPASMTTTTVVEPVKKVTKHKALFGKREAAVQPKTTPVTHVTRRSKVILVTGDRRTGVSSVVSNYAIAAQHAGLRSLVIDLDFARRGQSINFPVYHDPDDAQYTTPLWNAIKNPFDVEQCAVIYDEGIEYLGTSMYVSDYATLKDATDSARLQKLVSIALNKYDLVIIDCPFEDLKQWGVLIPLSASIVHVMNNDPYSVYGTINMLCPESFTDESDYQIYIPKMHLLLNNTTPVKLQGYPVDAEHIRDIFAALTGDSSYLDYSVLGEIPHIEDMQAILEASKQPALSGYLDTYMNIYNFLEEA